jgi:ArsR family transcriptional regulator
MNASDVKTFFEATAAEWDTMRLTYYDETVIDTLADAIAIDSEQTVLDVGTGTGFIAAGLAPRAGRVIAIDNSAAMLDVARDNLAQLGIDNLELREADLTQLPLDDDSTDAAVANVVLHHAEDPAVMLAEMTRVVRPGGRVAITDAISHSYEWIRTEQADIWLGFTLEQVRGFFDSARLTRYGYATLGSQ